MFIERLPYDSGALTCEPACTLTVGPALQATIASWRLGWNFTAKEIIQSPSNVYTPGVDILALDPPNVQLQGSNVNLTIKPFSWTEISFLGTKSTTPVPAAQYKASHSPALCANLSERLKRRCFSSCAIVHTQSMILAVPCRWHRWMGWPSIIWCAPGCPSKRPRPRPQLHP